MGVDIYEVIRAAATKPFGFVPYYPGPGLGGHCIPIDPFYLTWKAREYGLHTRFIELAGEVNSNMPAWVVEKLILALNARRKTLNGSKILILGIAYKENIDDMRESPAVEIMEQLRHKHAQVAYSDPYIPVFPKMRNYHFELKSTPLTAENIKAHDAVMVITAHKDFDFAFVKQHAQLIVDTRGVYQELNDNIVRA
jgi:UDP-N-acetyl-D-glucosamine dehydrogenase